MDRPGPFAEGAGVRDGLTFRTSRCQLFAEIAVARGARVKAMGVCDPEAPPPTLPPSCGDPTCYAIVHCYVAGDEPPLLLPETIAVVREEWDSETAAGGVAFRWITIAFCPNHPVLTLTEFREYVERPDGDGKRYKVFLAQGFAPPTA
jgi:hypothetical protein